jgi:small subunit ribosomal protein S6
LATNVYETMLIFDSNKYAQDMAGVSGAATELINKLGGEVLVSRLWNEMKLAYPIDGHRKGTYWLLYYKLDSLKLLEFARQLRLNESILRELTIRIDPRLVDALVTHARGGAPRLRPAPEAVAAAIDDLDE